METNVSDENECKYRPCDIFAHCTNTLGSFQCSCFPGYQGDGFHCEGTRVILPLFRSRHVHSCIPDAFIFLSVGRQTSTSAITRHSPRDAWRTPSVATFRPTSCANASRATSATARSVARMWTSAWYLARAATIPCATISRAITLAPVNLVLRETRTNL